VKLTEQDWVRMNREHYDKFEALSQLIGIGALKRLVPASEEELRVAYEADKHLNTIKLERWDNMGASVLRLRKAARSDTKKFLWSPSDGVCVLKHVARYYVLNVPPPPEVT
jgi:hypothetical protein